MPSNKDKPKKIQSEFVSKASEELEDAVAVTTRKLSAGEIEEDVEEVVDPPVRNRGPQ